MNRPLALLALGGCWTGSISPASPPSSPPSTVLAPGAAYAPLFVPGTLTFPAKIVIRRASRSKTFEELITCEVTRSAPDLGVLDCQAEVRLPDWSFRRDERGLWLDFASADVHLMQAVPKRSLLAQSADVWDLEVRVKAHAGAWCTNYAWAGESTVGNWTLCLRDDKLVGGYYTVERDDGTETVAFGEATR